MERDWTCGTVPASAVDLVGGGRWNHRHRDGIARRRGPGQLCPGWNAAAAGEAQIDVVRLLLDRGAFPNGSDGKSWLPLASAAQSGDLEVVNVLLAAGANPKAKPAGGHKLVEYARGPFAEEIRTALEQSASAKDVGKKKRRR